jgi:ectoine hydroxylase-related dioxygenase (phytanoyl-CoA dioxygenase family)
MDDLRQAWEQDGYVVLRGAAPTDQVAAYAQDLETARDGLLVRGAGDGHVSLASASAQASDDHAVGAVDPYALSAAARALLLPPDLVRFLTRDVFGGDAPLLFDAVEANAGSPDDAPFRDATYIALASEPETLTTATVALQDGAALTLFPGSQEIATTPFSGRYHHYNVERDGDAALQRHRDELAAALGTDPAGDTITMNAGDAVLWSAGLVHTPITGTALIAHLCPIRVHPSWFIYRPERARYAAYADETARIATQHYDLTDAVAPEQPPAGVQDEPELERVQEALREHDDNHPPIGPSSVAGRRSGGLVNSVRGLMNRRGRGD